jgi:hypothetical protein
MWLHEFTPALVAVATSLAIKSRPLHGSNVHHNDGITVTFSPETISVSGIHPTLGLDIRHDMDRQRF